MVWRSNPEPGVVSWRLHLRSGPEAVYRVLSTDEGRESFWAEEAKEVDGVIHWKFPNGLAGPMKVLERGPPTRFVCEYLDDSVVEFVLVPDGKGGTDLTLTHRGVAPKWEMETTAGWISVLLNLKGVADHHVDLRTHDPDRTWDQGFVEN
jgi:uncharacterized protein YndB with AHSA1/START domain